MAVHQANMSAWAEGMILPTYPAKTQFHSGEAWAHGILLPIWTTNTQANTQLIQSDASYIAESLYPSLERNLVGAWSPGEQRPGALLIDRQGQLDLSPSGNVHFVRDEGRWSSDSDGTNDYWTGTYDSNPIPGAFAISAWIYRDSTAGSYFGLGSSAATRQAIHLQTTNATTIRFGMYGDDLDATVTSLNGRWCHIVCQMLPDNTQQVWQDGTLINSRSAGGFFAGNGVLMLHQNSYNALSDWNGRIDDVFLWSRHLLAHEIRTLARSRGHAYRFGQAEYATSRIEKYSVLKQDLVGAWGLTNTPQPMGGTTLYDWSGRGNHGTLTNMAPATDYVINGGGRALDFDGTNDYVSGDGVDIANTPFAISAWVKTSTFNDRTYVGVGSAQAQRESLHLRFTSSTNLRFGLWNDDLNATITDPTGEWTHFVCQLDASLQQTVWQNGEQIGSRTAGGLFTGTDDWTIGRYTPTAIDFFDGEIDDVLIFPRALAPQEIRLLASRRGIIHDMHDVSPFAV